MRAIVQDGYGPPPDVLKLTELDRPQVGDDEVLIRIRAASMHPDVWHVVTGQPYVLRIMGSGLRRPKHVIPGTDIAGTVEAVGTSATRFRSGDEVFGEIVRGHQWKNGGAFAEFASAREKSLALKPAGITFEAAAAVPTSALIALQGVRYEGRVRSGQKVLVNGAAGGVGAFAVQIAKAEGADVTGVDAPEKLDLLRQIGADHIIDYTRDDFTRSGVKYDVIIDIPVNRTIADIRRSLTRNGTYVLIGHEAFGGSGGRWIGTSLARIIRLVAVNPFVPQRLSPRIAKEGEEPISVLRDLLEKEKITPIIDRTFELEEVPAALSYLTEGRARGKIVITCGRG